MSTIGLFEDMPSALKAENLLESWAGPADLEPGEAVTVKLEDGRAVAVSRRAAGLYNHPVVFTADSQFAADL